MTELTTEKNVKHQIRKDLRDALLGGQIGELMVQEDFETCAQRLWILDDVKTRISHQVRAKIQNDLLSESPDYPEILEMQRDKDSDREEIAKRIKKALKDTGHENSDITDLRDRALAANQTYQLMDIVKQVTEKTLLGILMKRNIWTKYLQNVRGISVLTASKLLYMVGDITRFSQPSKLVKYSGLAVIDGEPDRLKKGEEATYKPDLKALLLGVVGDNFLRADSQYRRIYDERKSYTSKHRPDWGTNPKTKKTEYKAHYHADAQRVMVKRFVVEFWKSGWRAEGLEAPTKPYPVAILGHDEEPDIVPYG